MLFVIGGINNRSKIKVPQYRIEEDLFPIIEKTETSVEQEHYAIRHVRGQSFVVDTNFKPLYLSKEGMLIGTKNEENVQSLVRYEIENNQWFTLDKTTLENTQNEISVLYADSQYLLYDYYDTELNKKLVFVYNYVEDSVKNVYSTLRTNQVSGMISGNQLVLNVYDTESKISKTIDYSLASGASVETSKTLGNSVFYNDKLYFITKDSENNFTLIQKEQTEASIKDVILYKSNNRITGLYTNSKGIFISVELDNKEY